MRWHIGQPRSQLGLEAAELLVDRGEFAGVRQALAGEPAKVSIFADFSVVDVPLAPDPLHQHVRKRRGWIETAETVIDLHTVIRYSSLRLAKQNALTKYEIQGRSRQGMRGQVFKMDSFDF